MHIRRRRCDNKVIRCDVVDPASAASQFHLTVFSGFNLAKQLETNSPWTADRSRPTQKGAVSKTIAAIIYRRIPIRHALNILIAYLLKVHRSNPKYNNYYIVYGSTRCHRSVKTKVLSLAQATASFLKFWTRHPWVADLV